MMIVAMRLNAPMRARPLLVAVAAAVAVLVAGPARASAQRLFAVVVENPRYHFGASSLESGLFTSRDAGHTWRQLGPRNLKGYSMDAFDSSRGAILYIAAGNGVHRSTDSGATWKIVTDWRVSEVMDVKVDQHDRRRVWAATAFGLWRSSDGGDHWEQPEGALRDRYCYRLYADAEENIDGMPMLRALTDVGEFDSRDGGDSWIGPDVDRTGFTHVRARIVYSALSTMWSLWGTGGGPRIKLLSPDTLTAYYGEPGPPPMNVYDLTVDGAGMTYAAGDSGLWRCELRTTAPSWKRMPIDSTVRVVHAVVVSGDDVIAGTYGEGIWRFDGRHWEPSGLAGAMVWSLHRREWE